jgi:hypothetical protein
MPDFRSYLCRNLSIVRGTVLLIRAPVLSSFPAIVSSDSLYLSLIPRRPLRGRIFKPNADLSIAAPAAYKFPTLGNLHGWQVISQSQGRDIHNLRMKAADIFAPHPDFRDAILASQGDERWFFAHRRWVPFDHFRRRNIQ